MSDKNHSKEEMQQIAEKHGLTEEELQKHMEKHAEFGQSHEILLGKEFTDSELEIMAKEHGMTLEQMKEHIAIAKAHHS